MRGMSFLFKKIAAPLLLVSFLLVALLGFVAMSYGPDGQMDGGCPFSAAGAALCPQDTAAVVLHHLGAFQAFLNVPLDSTIFALISALLLLACLLVLKVRPLLFQPVAHRCYSNTSPPVSARVRKITRWLSLLENSPSLV